nr:hypothetical protein [Tanacetum cinerariifolium]
EPYIRYSYKLFLLVSVVMSPDSAVAYSFIHSEARSWSIPSEDPYEEAAQQLFEQAPHSPEDTTIIPIPLSTPSTSCRAGIPEADTPPQNRPLLATPRPGCEVGESFAAATRRPGPTMAHRVDCSYVETRLRDTEKRMIAALELVNLRKDRAAARAEIEVLRSERLAYEQEVLETHARRLEWQRQAADDLAVQHIMRTQALEAGARDDTLEDTDSKAVQTMIDQALLRNSGGGDGSHSLHAENPRNMHTIRRCYYADFMKCHPLDFKGTEGVVGLTCWIKKMESVFNISGCAVENQIRTLGLDAYTMTWSMLKKKMTDKYCPLGEVKKLEIELWNLKVRDNNIPAYTNHFQETEKVDKYINGLPDNIYGNDTMPAIAGSLATPMLLIIEAAMGQTPGEMVVLSVEIRDISREIVLS